MTKLLTTRKLLTTIVLSTALLLTSWSASAAIKSIAFDTSKLSQYSTFDLSYSFTFLPAYKNGHTDVNDNVTGMPMTPSSILSTEVAAMNDYLSDVISNGASEYQTMSISFIFHDNSGSKLTCSFSKAQLSNDAPNGVVNLPNPQYCS